MTSISYPIRILPSPFLETAILTWLWNDLLRGCVELPLWTGPWDVLTENKAVEFLSRQRKVHVTGKTLTYYLGHSPLLTEKRNLFPWDLRHFQLLFQLVCACGRSRSLLSGPQPDTTSPPSDESFSFFTTHSLNQWDFLEPPALKLPSLSSISTYFCFLSE